MQHIETGNEVIYCGEVVRIAWPDPFGNGAYTALTNGSVVSTDQLYPKDKAKHDTKENID